MPVPWMQIVQLVPSIVDVSRELLRRSKAPPPESPPGSPQSNADLVARIAALEENERRQAELVSQMAEQLAALTRAATALHRQFMWLTVGLGVAVIVALVAIGIAIR
jgi:hypothetical protein